MENRVRRIFVNGWNQKRVHSLFNTLQSIAKRVEEENAYRRLPKRENAGTLFVRGDYAKSYRIDLVRQSCLAAPTHLPVQIVTAPRDNGVVCRHGGALSGLWVSARAAPARPFASERNAHALRAVDICIGCLFLSPSHFF
jgi:hypothetical protein